MKNNYQLPNFKEALKRDRNIVETISFNIDQKYLELGKNKKYYIITHGCQANQADSENIAGLLEKMGYTKANNENEADLILINTCAIREGAEEKVLGQIGALKRLKTTKPDLIIGVCGCMVQEEGSVKKIIDTYKQVDLVFGTHNITSLPRLIYEIIESHNRQIEVFSKMGEVYENVPVTRTSNHKAWVNIMYGCDKFCTYCIVPYTRGKQRSRKKEYILNEVKQLKQQGYKEICLLGQNVNAYGKDLYSDYDFASLLSDVSQINIDRIRFMTSHPWDFNDQMIEVIKNNTNIMPYIHLPLQSGSDRILKKMNRNYTKQQYLTLFDKLKNNIPGCTFTTDIIVGFPNETEEDFKQTLEVYKHCQYDNAFTFIFSARPFTPASKMSDEVSLLEKQERLKRLNELVAYYANLNNQKYLNKTLEVLVDGISKNNDLRYSGYSRENKLVNFNGENIQIGEYVNVKIEEVHSFSLNGTVINK